MTLLHIPLSELQASRPPPGHLHLQSQRHCKRNGSPKRGISPSVPAQLLPPLTPPHLTQQLHQERALKPGSCLDFSAPDTLCVQSPRLDAHPCVFLKPSSSLRKLPPPPTERLLCGMQPQVPCTHSPHHKHGGLSLKKARSQHHHFHLTRCLPKPPLLATPTRLPPFPVKDCALATLNFFLFLS